MTINYMMLLDSVGNCYYCMMNLNGFVDVCNTGSLPVSSPMLKSNELSYTCKYVILYNNHMFKILMFP